MDDALAVRGGEAARELDAISIALRMGIGAASVCRSVSPSRSSMTANAVPASRPKSKMARMFGWYSAATALASRSKRASAPDAPPGARAAP